MGADYIRGLHSINFGLSSDAMAANSTRYYNPVGGNDRGALGNAQIQMPMNCIIDHLEVHVDGPVGAGETITLTAMIEAVAQALSVQIGGAVDVEGDDLVNAIVLAAGDRLCFRCVTSLNSTPQIIWWAFRVRKA